MYQTFPVCNQVKYSEASENLRKNLQKATAYPEEKVPVAQFSCNANDGSTCSQFYLCVGICPHLYRKNKDY